MARAASSRFDDDDGFNLTPVPAALGRLMQAYVRLDLPPHMIITLQVRIKVS